MPVKYKKRPRKRKALIEGGGVSWNEQQIKFFMYYLTNGNVGVDAAISAGYTTNRGAAARRATLILNKPGARDFIAMVAERRLLEMGRDADAVLDELARVGFSDLRHVVDESGQLIPMHMLPAHVTTGLKTVKTKIIPVPGTDGKEVEEIREYQSHDKIKALQLLGTNLRIFGDKKAIEINGDVIIQRMEQGRKRAYDERQQRLGRGGVTDVKDLNHGK